MVGAHIVRAAGACVSHGADYGVGSARRVANDPDTSVHFRKEKLMPTYDYFCEANGVTVEVSHPIRERLTTWGAVCGAAGIPVGDTLPGAQVTRLISRAGVIQSKVLRNPELPPCQTGAPCCGAQRCGFG